MPLDLSFLLKSTQILFNRLTMADAAQHLSGEVQLVVTCRVPCPMQKGAPLWEDQQPQQPRHTLVAGRFRMPQTQAEMCLGAGWHLPLSQMRILLLMTSELQADLIRDPPAFLEHQSLVKQDTRSYDLGRRLLCAVNPSWSFSVLVCRD